MDKWTEAINFVLAHEGGFSNHKNDPGGPTDFGVSLMFLKSQKIDVNDDGKINIDDIKDLTKETAKNIYKTYWWDKYGYSSFVSGMIAKKVFDMAVNMGAHQAHILLQRAVNRLGTSKLVEDGILGYKTLTAANSLHPLKLYKMLQEVSLDFYNRLVIKNPKLTVFMRGWYNRAMS